MSNSISPPIIETDRLIVRPLTYNQLHKYLKNDHSLEKELMLNKTFREISSELKEALEQTILPSVADESKNYLYSTLWTIISRQDHQMVGDLCIIGEPNANGEIEIGYGTYEAFQNRGYMTEAVGGLIKWAKNQPGIVTILASTNADNIPSSSILQKNNFTKVDEKEGMINWKLTLLSQYK